MMHDPLPPLDSVSSYTLPRPTPRHMADLGSSNPLLLFLRSMLPTFQALVSSGASYMVGGGGGGEELLQVGGVALAGVGGGAFAGVGRRALSGGRRGSCKGQVFIMHSVTSLSKVYLVNNWRASEASETLSGVTQSRFRYIYLFIWYVGPLFSPALLITSW